jgi:FkbM family methyltransferase
MAALTSKYSVQLVPVDKTSVHVFGRHYIPINVMLEWAAARNTAVLIVNSDIELTLSPWELKRLRWLSDGGLCYFVRHNYDRDRGRTAAEPYGIDAFLLHGRDAHLFSESFLSMGQPFWDYWLPYTLAVHNRPIFSVEFRAALHRNHPRQWSWDKWHLCALEFDRSNKLLGADRSWNACMDMAVTIRRSFDANRTTIPPAPGDIRQWVQQSFGYPGRKLFLELGAHDGTDTAWMARLPGVTIHAFEPDPRNHPPEFPNVTVHRVAVAACDGHAPFVLSKDGWGRDWTYSSSIKTPKHHLQRYPVSFGDTIDVAAVSLDTFTRQYELGTIDFIWADIQGAEGDMVSGGLETLARTKYLYTEYSDDELYENQMPLCEILSILPDFRVVELWPDDVLLQNRKLTATASSGACGGKR